jgi:16S rRNA (guanine966-N2)-methyltransferase
MARGLRVIGGTAGGRRLVAPKSDARPTSDRVKEALFNVLGETRVRGAHVLDLYAGSGALGIEALSRGAARAVFVDRDRAAVAAIDANLVATGLAELGRVHRATASTFLARDAPRCEPFDLVLVDPPYDLGAGDLAAALDALAVPGRLAPGAAVVLERARAAAAPRPPEGWTTEFERAYGDTLLQIVTP